MSNNKMPRVNDYDLRILTTDGGIPKELASAAFDRSLVESVLLDLRDCRDKYSALREAVLNARNTGVEHARDNGTRSIILVGVRWDDIMSLLKDDKEES